MLSLLVVHVVATAVLTVVLLVVMAAQAVTRAARFLGARLAAVLAEAKAGPEAPAVEVPDRLPVVPPLHPALTEVDDLLLARELQPR